MLKCEKSDYLQRYNSFYARYKGGCRPPHNWFDLVEDAHIDIRSFLGGVEKDGIFDFEDCDPVIKDYSVIEPEIIRLTNILPGYFTDFKFAPKNMCYPLIPVEGKFKGMKWSTHIAHYARNEKINKEQEKELSSIMATMNKKWLLEKTKKTSLRVVLSTHPAAFMMLGHYNCDGQSCFKDGGANHIHKYILGQTKDSYVGIISFSDNTKEYLDLDKPNVARFWGASNESHTIFNVNNIYVGRDYEKHRANIFKAIKLAIGSVLSTDSVQIFEGRLRYTTCYQNKTENWSICSTHLPKFTDQSIVEKVGIFKNPQACQKCFVYCLSTDLSNINSRLLCCECCKDFVKCELCSKYAGSKSDIYTGYRNKKELKVCLNCIKTHFMVSSFSGKHIHINEVVRLSDSSYSSREEAEEKGLKPCKNCAKYGIINDGKRFCFSCELAKEMQQKLQSVINKNEYEPIGSFFGEDEDKDEF
jgi:hypothetical protein